MNKGIDVPQIQRFGALYIASARLKSMSKWRTIIAAVDIGNPFFYLIAVGIGIGVLVEQGSGTSGTNGIKYIAFIAPALLANTAITGIMDETVFPTIEGFKWRKLFFAQNATPITGRQIALGVYLPFFGPNEIHLQVIPEIYALNFFVLAPGAFIALGIILAFMQGRKAKRVRLEIEESKRLIIKKKNAALAKKATLAKEAL